jgi:signal transduction histidine kinase
LKLTIPSLKSIKIEDRTSALRQAYKELDTFFYRSSHDFRRPLTTFLGLAEVAKITVKDASALELFSKVKETANNLDKMLIKLQSISDVGTQQLVYKEVWVKEIFESICNSFADELRNKNISVSCFVEMKDSFYSYPAMFKTIIENLIENSIFFSGVEQPYIKVKAYDRDGQLILEVEDNGQGIDVQYRDRIFDMYFRGNERSKGNGLGLYIVKKAVEKLSGQITFQSVFGKGSTFSVSLPANHSDG